jgi:hypothetical protein
MTPFIFQALRLMELAEHFEIPVVTLIDTVGAYPSFESEQTGQSEAIATNLLKMVLSSHSSIRFHSTSSQSFLVHCNTNV